MLAIKNTVIEMTYFDELISRLDTAEERIFELDISIGTAKSEKQNRDWKKKKKQYIQGLWDNYKMYKVCVMEYQKKKKRKEQKKYLNQ